MLERINSDILYADKDNNEGIWYIRIESKLISIDDTSFSLAI